MHAHIKFAQTVLVSAFVLIAAQSCCMLGGGDGGGGSGKEFVLNLLRSQRQLSGAEIITFEQTIPIAGTTTSWNQATLTEIHNPAGTYTILVFSPDGQRSLPLGPEARASSSDLKTLYGTAQPVITPQKPLLFIVVPQIANYETRNTIPLGVTYTY
jgi:hypothetical protein